MKFIVRWSFALAAIVLSFLYFGRDRAESDTRRLSPAASIVVPKNPAVGSMDLPAPPRDEAEMVPDPGEVFLRKVIERFGAPERLPDFSPHEQGRWLAIKNKAPLYPSRLAAILDRLKPPDQARLMDCISAMIGDGSLPSDYLTEPLRERALIWDPVAQESVSNMVLFGLSKDLDGARVVFRNRLLEQYGVGRSMTPRINFSSPSKLNPEAKTIPGQMVEYLRSLERECAKAIVEAVDHGPIADFYLDARAAKLADEDFIALPFNAVFLLSSCGEGARRRVIDGVGARDGWTVQVEVKPGDSPAYDLELARIDGILTNRDSQIKAYIQSLP